jgi:catechol 2,3-dioxygenase-like lactoylglutathione lyase family enzyme
MAKIKHIGIISLDPARLAEFYEQVFDMTVLHRSKSGAVYMTDGYMNIALLPNKAEGKPNGLNHFGFHIDDQEEIAARLDKFGIAPPADRPADWPFAEKRATDPDGNNYDLSVHGFQAVEYAAHRKKKQTDKVDASKASDPPVTALIRTVKNRSRAVVRLGLLTPPFHSRERRPNFPLCHQMPGAIQGETHEPDREL